MITELGKCKCGCGGKTRISTRNHNVRGWVKNQPLDFIHGHNCNGEINPHWNGGTAETGGGYIWVTSKGHHRANKNGYVLEHILVAEKKIGRLLTDLEVVHHEDENKKNNSPDNLMVFPSQSEHMIYHARKTALLECGNPNWRKCYFCHTYDDTERMIHNKSSRGYYHSECRKIRRRITREIGRN